MSRHLLHKQGQTLVEMLVVVGVSIILVTGIVAATTASLRANSALRLRERAVTLAQQGLELARQKRDLGWGQFQLLADVPTTYCVGTDVAFEATVTDCSASMIDDMFQRSVRLDYQSTQDPPRIVVTSTVSWIDTSVTLTTFFTDWK